MFAGEKKASAEPKSPLVNEKPAGKLAGKEPNPVWQSLAFSPATIQTKLDISHPEDPSEQEADRIADQVLRMPDAETAVPEPVTGLDGPPRIQRLCSPREEEVQRQPAENLQAEAHSGRAAEGASRFMEY